MPSPPLVPTTSTLLSFWGAAERREEWERPLWAQLLPGAPDAAPRGPCLALVTVPGAATHAQTRCFPRGSDSFLSFIHVSILCIFIGRGIMESKLGKAPGYTELRKLRRENRDQKTKKPENKGTLWWMLWRIQEFVEKPGLGENLLPVAAAGRPLSRVICSRPAGTQWVMASSEFLKHSQAFPFWPLPGTFFPGSRPGCFQVAVQASVQTLIPAVNHCESAYYRRLLPYLPKETSSPARHQFISLGELISLEVSPTAIYLRGYGLSTH